MRTQTWMTVLAGAVVVGLAGCGGDRSADNANQPPATPSTTDFSTYAQSLVSTYSCDTNPPAETDSIEFAFDASQDTAAAASTDDVMAACKV